MNFMSMTFAVVKIKLVKDFRADSSPMKWSLLGVFLHLYSPKYDLNWLQISAEVVFKQKKQYLATISKVYYFVETERTQSLHFWCILGPNLPWENQNC